MSEQQNLITAMVGHETFGESMAKLHMFYWGYERDGVARKEVNMMTANAPTAVTPGDRLNTSMVRVAQRANAVPASAKAGGFEFSLGSWRQTVIGVSDLTLMKVYAQRKVGWSARREAGCLLLLARSTAAYREITVELTGNPDARFARARVEGRFDILTLEQACDEHGYSCPPGLRFQFDSGNHGTLFRQVTEVEAELVALPRTEPRVLEIAGETHVVRAPVRRRSFNLDV